MSHDYSREGEQARRDRQHIVEQDAFNNLHRWRWTALTIWIIIFSIAVIYWGITTRHNVHDIQKNRHDVLLHNCIDQNQRHNSTIHELHVLILNVEKKHPNEKAQLKQSTAFTTLLIDAIIPLKNCTIAVAKQLSQKPQ